MQQILKPERLKAQSTIEMVAGLLILVPIVLFLVDMGILIWAGTYNDLLAKNAARAAANQANTGSAQTAANNAISSFKTSAIFPKVTQTTNYDTVSGNVTVTTNLTVKLPMPFPFLPSQSILNAQTVEPILGLPAS